MVAKERKRAGDECALKNLVMFIIEDIKNYFQTNRKDTCPRKME